MTTTASGLQYEDTLVGTGATATKGQSASFVLPAAFARDCITSAPIVICMVLLVASAGTAADQ